MEADQHRHAVGRCQPRRDRCADQLVSRRDLRWLVDPGWPWKGRRNWRVANEAFWMSGVGLLKHAASLKLGDAGAPEVHIGWCVEADTGVAVLSVVPGEEFAAECQAMLDGPKTLRELWPVLERLELAFRERIVVGHLRA